MHIYIYVHVLISGSNHAVVAQSRTSGQWSNALCVYYVMVVL